MGRGRKRRIVKDAAKKGTLHQFYKRTISGRPRVRYNPLKENDESTSKFRRYIRSVSKPKTIEQSGSKKDRNIGASKSKSSEQQSKGNKEPKSKNVTVYVTVKGATARVETVNKETMSCSASKATNKKGNNLAKKEMRQHQMSL